MSILIKINKYFCLEFLPCKINKELSCETSRPFMQLILSYTCIVYSYLFARLYWQIVREPL